MKFELRSDGDTIEAEIVEDGKGGFTGLMHFAGHRDAELIGTVKAGVYSGTVKMDGHAASFEAAITDRIISGRLSVPWPLSVLFHSRNFTGTEIA